MSFKYSLNKSEQKEIFHGGCLDCYSQDLYDINRCNGCRYHDANWDRPDLHIKESKYIELLTENKKEKEMPSMGFAAPIPPMGRPQAPRRPQMFDRKPMNREKRLNATKHYFEDIQKEYHEDNIPTNIFAMFAEVLDAMPKDDLIRCETLGLFKDALEERIGIENAKSKNKKYI